MAINYSIMFPLGIYKTCNIINYYDAFTVMSHTLKLDADDGTKKIIFRYETCFQLFRCLVSYLSE